MLNSISESVIITILVIVMVVIFTIPQLFISMIVIISMYSILYKRKKF